MMQAEVQSGVPVGATPTLLAACLKRNGNALVGPRGSCPLQHGRSLHYALLHYTVTSLVLLLPGPSRH